MNELKKKFFFIILATQFSTIKKKNFEKEKEKEKKRKESKHWKGGVVLQV